MAELKVRYFAAARAAAGTDSETVAVDDETTVADVLRALTQRHAGRFATVAEASSLLLDGLAVRSPDTYIASATELDVLPPFAGG